MRKRGLRKIINAYLTAARLADDLHRFAPPHYWPTSELTRSVIAARNASADLARKLALAVYQGIQDVGCVPVADETMFPADAGSADWWLRRPAAATCTHDGIQSESASKAPAHLTSTGADDDDKRKRSEDNGLTSADDGTE